MDKKIKHNPRKNDPSVSVQIFHNHVSDTVASNRIVLRFYFHVQKKFLVSLGAGDGGGDNAMDPESNGFKELGEGQDDFFMQNGIFNDTPFADAISTDLKLRFDEGYHGGIGFKELSNSRYDNF